MGYTHYFTQTKNYTKAEWAVIVEDVSAILADVEHRQGVPLANGLGDLGSKPEIGADRISFNGRGDKDSHETFAFERVRTPDEWGGTLGSDFCKTARKPYDLAVTAVLCYLSSVAGKFHVTSDGHGFNFLAGLEAAKQALPRLSNQLDIPMGVMEADCWFGGGIRANVKAYSFGLCVDGRAYIMRQRDGRSYAFLSHDEARTWAATHRERFDRRYHFSESSAQLFSGSGSYDEARHKRIARQQKAAFDWMLDGLDDNRDPSRYSMKPPAYVRPGALPLMATEDKPAGETPEGWVAKMAEWAAADAAKAA